MERKETNTFWHKNRRQLKKRFRNFFHSQNIAPCGASAPQRIFHSKPLSMCGAFRLVKCPNMFDERVIQLILTI